MMDGSNMSDSTIASIIFQTITLGIAPYLSPISITNTGEVHGNKASGTAIVNDTIGITLDNAGNIFGADATMAILTGYFIGAAGSEIPTFKDVDYSVAGDGVSLIGAGFSNFGDISGGTGPSAGDYGAGIYLAVSTGSNSGLIQGGAAWGKSYGFDVVSNGEAAPGAALIAGYFQNKGTLLGGQGLDGVGPNPNNNIGNQGGQGGDGVILSEGALLNNSRLIKGGQGGLGGSEGPFYEPAPGLPSVFSGGTGGGGTGAYVSGGTIINSGLIVGGVGGAGNGGVQGSMGPMGTGAIIENGLLVNDGTISGGTDAVRFMGTGTLQVDAGAVFEGIVQANPEAGDILALSGNSGGTIWIGQEYLGFSTLDLSQGTSWTVEGDLTSLKALTITSLSRTDTLEIYGLTAAAPSYVSGVGLEVNVGTTLTVLPVEGGLNGATFIVAPCFCVGTHIRTPRGETLVENLHIGAEVMTAFAGVQHIKWIGRRDYTGSFIAASHLALPVCLKEGAIANGIPSRDLWVSPDHAICEDGVLIHAWRLINGVSIVQVRHVEFVSYIHIELQGHHVVFAENCATETFRDANCRFRFHNATEYETLYGFTEPHPPCLPLVNGGFHLHNIKSRLAARAGIIPTKLPPGPLRGNLDEVSRQCIRGWAQDVSSPEQPVLLDIFINGRLISKTLANYYRVDLREAGLGSGCHAFEVPVPPFVGAILVRRSSDGALLGEHLRRVI